jgi:hypothetical protein
MQSLANRLKRRPLMPGGLQPWEIHTVKPIIITQIRYLGQRDLPAPEVTRKTLLRG